MFVAKPEAVRAGFRFWKPLVWDKRTVGMPSMIYVQVARPAAIVDGAL